MQVTIKRFSFCFVLATGMLCGAESGYDLFQKGLAKERADADPRAAIKIYERVVRENAGNHKLAAQALIRLAECHEKLGNAESQKIYERVLREYADQKEAVALARLHLDGSAQPRRKDTEIKVQLVWSTPDFDTPGTPSPDGRYLAYVDWQTGDLGVRDLVAAKNRLLTNEGTWARQMSFQRGFTQNAVTPLFSPDGKQIVYTWFNKTVNELRVINTSAGSGRVFSRFLADEWVYPQGWSDGNTVIVYVTSGPKSQRLMQIAAISIVDGAIRVINKFETKSPGRLGSLVVSPDARYLAYDRPVDNDWGKRQILILSIADGKETIQLRDTADQCVLGWSPDGRYLLFASDRLGTQDAYLAPIADGRIQGQPQLIRRGIGGVKPMGFTKSGSFFYTVNGSLSGADVYTAQLDPISSKVVTPRRLATDGSGANSSIFFSPDGQRIAYRRGIPYWEKERRKWVFRIELVIRTLEDGSEQVLHPRLESYALRGWHPNGRSLLVQGTAVAENLGTQGVYQVNVMGGETVSVILTPGKRSNAPTWALNGRALVYETEQAVVVRDVATDRERQVYAPPAAISGISVSPDGKLIAVSDRTSIVVVPFEGGKGRELIRSTGREVIGPIAWMPDSQRLVYSKENGDVADVWHIDLSSGQSQEVGLKVDNIMYIAVSPDGRMIGFDSGTKSMAEVWAMENFLPGRD
jgi:Tol biopolymer transport system component